MSKLRTYLELLTSTKQATKHVLIKLFVVVLNVQIGCIVAGTIFMLYQSLFLPKTNDVLLPDNLSIATLIASYRGPLAMVGAICKDGPVSAR